MPAKDAFGRALDMLERAAEGGLSVSEAREHLADLVRMAGRLRGLERRLGRKGAASLSPFLESLLRLATGPRVIGPARAGRPARLRKAAG